MTFEEFWKQNKNRYKDLLFEFNAKLALHTACEEAWKMGEKANFCEDSIIIGTSNKTL